MIPRFLFALEKSDSIVILNYSCFRVNKNYIKSSVVSSSTTTTTTTKKKQEKESKKWFILGLRTKQIAPEKRNI